MPFKLFAPDGLECMAAAIQSFEFGGIRPFTAQITPLDPFPIHPGILFHVILSDFIFYWTGLTGFTGYFFGFLPARRYFMKIFSRPKGGIEFRHFLLESGEGKKAK